MRNAGSVRQRFLNAFAAALALAMLPGGVAAVEVPTLYTAEVPFDADSSDGRENAYELALELVLLRVSGSILGSDTAAIRELFPNPSSYVMQFRQGGRDKLWVSFDGQAIEQVLRDAGQPVWGADRPLTLVWLAVDWGQGSREIIGADDPERAPGASRTIDRNKLLRERILDVAERRGLPVIFPLLDTLDLQGVTFSDIWGGFDERIIESSKRYDANSILIGRVRPSSSRRENWTYYFSGEQRAWNGPPEAVVGQVADLLAAEFAVGGNAPLESVLLGVTGVVSVDAYGSVQQMLANVSLIESFRISAVKGDRVTYRVEVRGGAERLRRALRFNGLVEQQDMSEFGEARPASDLEFYFGR